MNPALRLVLARQRVADILAASGRARHGAGGREGSTSVAAPFRRLPERSWIYRRRDSS